MLIADNTGNISLKDLTIKDLVQVFGHAGLKLEDFLYDDDRKRLENKESKFLGDIFCV